MADKSRDFEPDTRRDASTDASSEQLTQAPSDTSPTIDEQEAAHAEWMRISELYKHRQSSTRLSNRRPSLGVALTQKPGLGRWKFTLRSWDDDEEQDWWFASTAVPLLAATIGPLANVLSIAALVTEWRECLVTGVTSLDAAQCVWDGKQSSLGTEINAVSFHDPDWAFYPNIVSLVVGFIGNFFLLCNFTNRIRYIVALPASIIMWTLATGILTAIVSAVEIYAPPMRPQQVYSQGYWYAVIAACLYMTCNLLLLINMIGYFLGHYPQHFNLTESQRTLILQTMLFFVWLAGGAGIFSLVERKFGTGGLMWSYVDALYFCDVTILTVGFGDLYATNSVSRGLLFPYAIGGIIMLGLVVSSVSKFATELSSENIIRRHVEHSRARTVGRSVTTSVELENRRQLHENIRGTISGPLPSMAERQSKIKIVDEKEKVPDDLGQAPSSARYTLRRIATLGVKPPRIRKPKLLLLREEKDRFDAMRRIQANTLKFKGWYNLFLSTSAFALLWGVGAAIFWYCERQAQHMTYFDALYFCYVSLLTIGYGDFAPRSNRGRPFFVLWSLVAVPTMAILVSDLGDTVVHKFKHGTFKLADFTVLPKEGVWREFLLKHPRLLSWLENRKHLKDVKRRLEEGFPTGPDPEEAAAPPTIEELAEDTPSNHELARRLASKIRHISADVSTNPKKLYTYEEWVEITQLIRFSAKSPMERDANDEVGPKEEVEEELIEWDWIGEDSPMMSHKNEADFVLDRLCESMHRYIKNVTDLLPKEAPVTQASTGREQSTVKARHLPSTSADPLGAQYPSFDDNFSFS